MNLLVNFFVFLIIVVTVIAEKKSYDGYKVYKIIPKSKEEVNALNHLQKTGLAEFWDEIFDVNNEIKVMVSPEKRNGFIDHMMNLNMEVDEVIHDLQKAIDDQLKPARHSARNSNTFLSYNWNEYHNLAQIYNWLDELETTYPDIVTTVVIGKSVEDRDIKGIQINYNPDRNNSLIGMIEGGIHAREWISPATVTWIIKEFLTSSDPEVRALAENFEWHIFPVVNPDGYSYTFTDNRMWRKNRSKTNSTTCETLGVDDDLSNGVDLNRNFDFVWDSEGTSPDPCSNLFAGPAPFSEPESTAIKNYVTTLNEEGEMIYYIAFHSYTQLIIIPYSHLGSEDALLAGNFGDMYEIAIRGSDALNQRYGTQYRVGLSSEVMYKMSGTSFDWVKYATDIPVSYLIELRDLGEYGFILPSDQIVESCLEIMDAFLEMDRTTRKLGYYSGANSVLTSIFTLTFGVTLLLFNY